MKHIYNLIVAVVLAAILFGIGGIWASTEDGIVILLEPRKVEAQGPWGTAVRNAWTATKTDVGQRWSNDRAWMGTQYSAGVRAWNRYTHTANGGFGNGMALGCAADPMSCR